MSSAINVRLRFFLYCVGFQQTLDIYSLTFQECYNVQSHKQEKKLRWHMTIDKNVMFKKSYQDMITAIIINHLPATLPRPSSDTVTSGVWGQESNLDLNNTVSNPSITRIIWGLSWSLPLTSSCYLVHSKLTVIRIWSIIKTYSKMLRDGCQRKRGVTSATPLALFLSSREVFLPIQTNISNPQSRI